MSNVNNVKSAQICWYLPRSDEICPGQSRSYEIFQIVKMSIKLSKCQTNCQNVNQIVKMSIKLSNCHNIKYLVLSECVDWASASIVDWFSVFFLIILDQISEFFPNFIFLLTISELWPIFKIWWSGKCWRLMTRGDQENAQHCRRGGRGVYKKQIWRT